MDATIVSFVAAIVEYSQNPAPCGASPIVPDDVHRRPFVRSESLGARPVLRTGRRALFRRARLRPPGSTKPASRSSPFRSRSQAPPLAVARCALRLPMQTARPRPSAAVARPLRARRRRLSPTPCRGASRRVASLRRRSRPSRRPSAARLPARSRNRLGACAPSPLLAHSPDIDHTGYRRGLIAPWRSERIAAFRRSRDVRHGLRGLASRQLALVEERLEAPLPISIPRAFSTSWICATVTPLARCSSIRSRKRSSTSFRLSFGGASSQGPRLSPRSPRPLR